MNYRRIVNAVIFVAMLAVFAGCADEVMEEIPAPVPEVPEGYVRAVLDLQVAEHQLPQTRATDPEEQAYDQSNVWVLLFKATSSSDGTPTELLQAPVRATQQGGKLYALLRATTQPVSLYVVTGLAADLNAKLATGLPAGTSYEDVNSQLVTAPITTTGLPVGAGVYIPMASDRAFYSAGTMSIGSITQQLIRIVARIDVDASAINPEDFLLEGVSIATWADRGYILRQEYVGIGNRLQYDENTSVSGNKLTAQIYSYESGNNYGYTDPEGVRRGSYIRVYIKGRYKGGASGYYRVDFIKKNADGTYTLCPLERNHCYTVRITSVDNAGFTGPNGFAEANSNRPSAHPFGYELVVSDMLAYNVVSNGYYYLGVSNTELISYGGGDHQLIFRFTSNVPSGAGGIGFANSGYSIPGTTVYGSSYGEPDRLAFPLTNVPVEANMASVPVGFTSVGSVWVGNMCLNIAVEKKQAMQPEVNDGVISDFATGDYVVGKVMSAGTNRVRLSLDPNGRYSAPHNMYSSSSSLNNPTGGFYIYYSSVGQSRGALLGEVFFTKRNGERTKVAVYVQ